jgi:hypothetical protein
MGPGEGLKASSEGPPWQQTEYRALCAQGPRTAAPQYLRTGHDTADGTPQTSPAGPVAVEGPPLPSMNANAPAAPASRRAHLRLLRADRHGRGVGGLEARGPRPSGPLQAGS